MVKSRPVHYEQISNMLLNEFLKEHKKSRGTAGEHCGVEVNGRASNGREWKFLRRSLKSRPRKIQKVSAQIEVNKPAPQVVANKP